MSIILPITPTKGMPCAIATAIKNPDIAIGKAIAIICCKVSGTSPTLISVVALPQTNVDKQVSGEKQSSLFSHIKLIVNVIGVKHLFPCNLPPVILRQLLPKIKISLVMFAKGIK